jgi:16S rRNA (adenine1518-N6/adenine1519-N6)-dimethyltransferase
VESQYLYEVERLFNVPRTAFNPAPKVDSAIVRFHRRPQTPQDEELTAYFDLVKACFKQRRKTICNNMKEYLQDAQQAEQVLQSAGIDPGQRAQECAPEQFAVLLKEIRG